MKLAQKSFDRIKEILKLDKEQLSQNNLIQIKSDIYDTLKNYFEISLQDVSINYILNNDNQYEINISATSSKIKKSRVYF